MFSYGKSLSSPFAVFAVLGWAAFTLSGCLQAPEPPGESERVIVSPIAASVTAGLGGMAVSNWEVTALTTDLTPTGTWKPTEWNHYGQTIATEVNKGLNSPNQIVKTNIGTIYQYQPPPLPTMKYLKWTGGTPVASATSRNGLAAPNLSQGFKIELPASPQARMVWVYVSVYKAEGLFTSQVPGENLGQYSKYLASGTNDGYKTYCLKIAVKSPNTRKLTLNWTKSQDFGGGYIVLHAVSYTNFTDIMPKTGIKIMETGWGTPDYELGMCIVGKECGVAGYVINDGVEQPEGIKSVALYQGNQLLLDFPGGPATKYYLYPHFPNVMVMRYTVVATDNFGNTTTEEAPGLFPWQEMFFSGPSLIPDANAQGVTWIFNHPDYMNISDLRVRLNVTHSYIGDLVATLNVPSQTGPIWTMLNRNGGSADNLTNTDFIEGVPYTIDAGFSPFTGMYRPAIVHTPRTSYMHGQGQWSVKIADLAGSDVGTVNSIRVLARQ